MERKKTVKGGNKTKSKYGGTESVENHGKFILDIMQLQLLQDTQMIVD